MLKAKFESESDECKVWWENETIRGKLSDWLSQRLPKRFWINDRVKKIRKKIGFWTVADDLRETLGDEIRKELDEKLLEQLKKDAGDV